LKKKNITITYDKIYNTQYNIQFIDGGAKTGPL